MGIDVDGPLVTTAAEKDLVTGAASVASAEADWMDRLAAYDESGAWAEHGFFACSTWLAAACGLARITARERLRVSRALRRLRGVRAAFAAGRISYSAVRAITRIDDLTDEMEEALLEVARTGTVEDLEQLVRVWRDLRDQERAGDSLRRLEERRGARLSAVGDVVKLDAVLPADEGDRLHTTLLDASHDLPADTPRRVRLVVGLIKLADHWHSTAPSPRATSPAVQVRVDLETLEGGRSWAAVGGRAVSAETARRLACDAGVSRVLVAGESAPLDIGRTTRTVPPALRRALEHRDGGCVFPGCTSRHLLDAHHVVHWGQGGPTVLDNLALLCRHHHRTVHEGSWSLVPTAAGPRFVDPLERHHRPEPLDGWVTAARRVA